VMGSDLFVGTLSAGVWRRPLSGMIVSVDAAGVVQDPQSLSVANHPNPFNPKTTIEYVVPALRGGGTGSGQVSVSVYDLLGREVATLVDEVKTPGAYRVQFDGGGLPSGMYICRLRQGAHEVSRMMVLTSEAAP
jgi:hypothetical protein